MSEKCVLYNAPLCEVGKDCEACLNILDENWEFKKYKYIDLCSDRKELCCPACKRMLVNVTLCDDDYDCKSCDRCTIREVSKNG